MAEGYWCDLCMVFLEVGGISRPQPQTLGWEAHGFFFPCGKLFTRILMEIGEKEDSLVKNFPGLFLEGEVAKEDRAAVEPPASPASPGRALPRPLAGGSQGPGQGLRTLAPLATPAGWFSGAAGYPVHRRMLSSVHLLGAGSFALPSCDNQKCLQTLPDVPWGAPSPLVEDHLSVRW